jgi:hypothetical protein
MQILNQLYDQGYQPAAIAKQLSKVLRRQLVEAKGLPRQKSLRLLSKLIDVPASPEPASLLEITLLSVLTVADQPPETKQMPTEPSETEKPAPQSTSAKATMVFDDKLWPEVLATLKNKHNTLYGVARMAQPELDGRTLRLAFSFGFHQKRLNEPAIRQKISAIIKDMTGQSVDIECVVDKSITPPTPVTEGKPDDIAELSTVSNIFGGGELLES